MTMDPPEGVRKQRGLSRKGWARMIVRGGPLRAPGASWGMGTKRTEVLEEARAGLAVTALLRRRSVALVSPPVGLSRLPDAAVHSARVPESL